MKKAHLGLAQFWLGWCSLLTAGDPGVGLVEVRPAGGEQLTRAGFFFWGKLVREHDLPRKPNLNFLYGFVFGNSQSPRGGRILTLMCLFFQEMEVGPKGEGWFHHKLMKERDWLN